ncbi:MAG: HAMP domain-containing sensor histidine kinase [Nocardioidaceae bacterium]
MRLWRRLVGDRPIVTRLVVAVAAAMTVVLVLAAAFVYWRVSYALDRQLDQDLDAYEQVVDRAVRAGEAPPSDTPGETFQVYDGRGTVVAGNRDLAPLLDAARLADARTGTTRFDVGPLFPPSERPYRVLASTVSSSEGRLVVVSAISRRKHDEALRELLLQLGIADLMALVAASFVGYRTARAALDPVEGYRRAVEDLGDDDTGRRLPVADGRDDELSRLGHTFNDLLARIEASAARERQFLADASHELRTPLSLMRTELEWASHRPRSEAERATVMASMQDQVNRLVDLANALLDLEELRGAGPIPREDVVLSDVVRDAVRSAGPAADAVVVDATDVVVRVNRRWLEVAVGNLVANAQRHGAGVVRVAATVQDSSLRVSVRDDGPGFPADFVPQAFDRFSRAEESRTTPGSGLGLALVHEVAQAHGGRATVEPGPGGCVRLDVPVA